MQQLPMNELMKVSGGNLEAPMKSEIEIENNIERFSVFFAKNIASKYNKKVFEFEK